MWRWAAVALAIHGALFLGLLLGPGRGDPAWFIHLGSQRIPVVLARRVLGPGVRVPHLDGHDGRFFWVQARDPLLLHPGVDAANLDRPAYRAQRLAYPALAAPWRVFGEYGLVWGLVLTNLAILAVGAAIATSLALDTGAPARAGLAFALNPAVVVAVVFDTADALAVAGVLAAVLFLRRGRLAAAVASVVVAALAKEPSLLSFGAIALLMPRFRLRDRALLVGAPAAVAALWAAYSRWRLGWPASHIQEFTAPFYGYLDAYRRGWKPVGNWSDAFVAVVVVAIAAAVVVLWMRRRSLLMTAALPFALLVPFLSAQVLDLADNSLRALGPALTLIVIECYRPAVPVEPNRR